MQPHPELLEVTPACAVMHRMVLLTWRGLLTPALIVTAQHVTCLPRRHHLIEAGETYCVDAEGASMLQAPATMRSTATAWHSSACLQWPQLCRCGLPMSCSTLQVRSACYRHLILSQIIYRKVYH